MKISNLSKALLVMLLVVMAMGAFTVHTLTKERDALVKQKQQENDSIRLQFREREKQSGREKMVMVRRIDSLNILVKDNLRSIDSLGKELKFIPKRYHNKTSKELGQLMDKRANGN